ncbi:unnamed protein product [Calypogeia fissa]
MGLDEVMAEILNYLIPLVEEETSRIIDPLYTGHYIWNATPPSFSQPLNATIEILGGFIDLVDSPAAGLVASINLSLHRNRQVATVEMQGALLLKNSFENSFWLGGIGISCIVSFSTISRGPSTTDPNYPGTDYGYEIEFDFANKTALWPALGTVCLKI